MIARTARALHHADWRAELACAIRSTGELLAALDLSANDLPELCAAREFPLLVPRGFVRRMRRGDPRDPLLLLVLPLGAEQAPAPGYTPDPTGDLPALAAPGLLRKYRGRALLVTTGACAIHCRYCFRRHFPYRQAGGDWKAALAQVAADAALTEVILSGGDPLMLGTGRLAALLRRCADIAHVERLRLHTRLPIVLPERIDAELLALLGGLPRPTIVVVHANHPQEIDAAVQAALARLGSAGVRLFNQSVLLRGINDEAALLAELSERLFAAGVTPYYLHQLDPVQGAAHFAVPDEAARRIDAELRARLPGYLCPRLVRERPGAAAKEALTP